MFLQNKTCLVVNFGQKGPNSGSVLSTIQVFDQEVKFYSLRVGKFSLKASLNEKFCPWPLKRGLISTPVGEGRIPEKHYRIYSVDTPSLDLYNWSMDEIVSVAGRKSNCTFCGVFRRQALDRGAWQLEVDVVATGHNADDVAETVIMNMIRGDVGRLSRCTGEITL